MTRSTAISIAVIGIPFVSVIGTFFAFLYGGLPIDDVTVVARGQFGDSFGVLTSLFSGLGFAGVVATIWMQQLQIRSQEAARLAEVDERRSKFHLDTSADAYSQAWALLQDHNNDRVTWIRAGRLLGHARLAAARVTIEEHKLSLEITRLEYRTFFSELLEGKSAAFFFGGDGDLDIEEAARQSSAPLENQSQYSFTQRNIPTESLYAVWEAARWPENYEDPLDATFSEAERDKVKYLSRGLDAYLLHRDNWTSLGGVLRPRRRAEAAEANQDAR